MEGADSLHPNTVGNLSNGKGRVYFPFAFSYDHALENLNAFFVSLPNSHMNLYRIPWLELGDICPHLFSIK
jgi:hypothetical protein